VCRPDERESVKQQLEELLLAGRLPITLKNIEVITTDAITNIKQMINERSADAGLVIIGLREEAVKHEGVSLFKGYEKLGMTLYVNSVEQKKIE
jgi:hypothetical protein